MRLQNKAIKVDKQYILDRIKIDFNKCWIWQLSLESSGYGSVTTKNSPEYKAHRLAYRLFKGLIPKDMYVCHTCDVTNCCNPEHLFLGTPKQNSEDMTRKNRHRGNPSGKNGIPAAIDMKKANTIRLLYKNTNIFQKELAKIYGISQSYISQILSFKRRRKNHE